MLRAQQIFCCFFALLLANTLPAQNPGEAKRIGERAYTNQRWQEAQTYLAQYQDARPGNLGVLTKLGISLYQLRRGEEARRYLEYVAAKSPNTKDADLLYYLAATRHGLGDWEKAIAAYKSYMRSSKSKHPLRAQAIDQIRRCVSGMQITQNKQVALVEGLGNRVNSAGDEFAPIPSLNYSDRLYFASARSGCIGGERNDAGYDDRTRGHWCSDMFTANLSNSGWEIKGGLGGLLNTSRFEVPLGFNSDGQILYFFRGFTTYSGEIFADTATKKDEYSINLPAMNGPVNAEQGDTNPFFFNDLTLVFASRRAGGYGGLDLWWSIWADSTWSTPVNLGPEVNSEYDEDMPFLAKDGATLYFSSNRITSIGGLDIFKTVFDAQLYRWQMPENLGMPINTPLDDSYFRLSADGLTGFFASDRMGGLGERDLYIAYFRESQPEQAPPNTLAVFTQAAEIAPPTLDVQELVIPNLAYQNEADILSAAHLKTIDQVAKTTQMLPTAYVLVTSHTEASGQLKFDLYNGIKRAEILGKALAERGVPANKIILRSVGPNFPLAREVLNAAPNPAAPDLNRRLEMTLTALAPLPILLRIDRPFVSEIMAANGPERLEKATEGLSYTVQAATTRQILTNDALAMFSDVRIETPVGSGQYRYTAGSFKEYSEAAQLKKELQNQGFSDATVVAYLQGIRISKAEAVAYLKKYPDLAGFIRGN